MMNTFESQGKYTAVPSESCVVRLAAGRVLGVTVLNTTYTLSLGLRDALHDVASRDFMLCYVSCSVI